MVDFIKPENIDVAQQKFVENTYNDVIMGMLVRRWTGEVAILDVYEIEAEVEKVTGVNIEAISRSENGALNELLAKYTDAGWSIEVSTWDSSIYFSVEGSSA